MLNARDKLSKPDFIDSKNGFPHSYVLSSEGSSPGSWGKLANVFRFSGIGFLKGGKQASNEKMGNSNRQEPSASPGIWGSGGRTSIIDISTMEDAYPMSLTGSKRSDKVGFVASIWASLLTTRFVNALVELWSVCGERDRTYRR